MLQPAGTRASHCRQRFERRNVERVKPVDRLADQVDDGRKESGQRFAGTRRSDQQSMFTATRRGYNESQVDLLRDHDAALCLSDHAAAPAPWEATASFIYVRGHGSEGRYAGYYSDETLAAWSSQIQRWRGEGRGVYVYFDNDVKSAAPADADRLIALTDRP